jgi:hypothetical protein
MAGTMGWTLTTPAAAARRTICAGGGAGHSDSIEPALKAMNIMPISGSEHEFTQYGFRDLLKRGSRYHPVRYQPRGRHHPGAQSAAWRSPSVPVIPHAGQITQHVVMAS